LIGFEVPIFISSHLSLALLRLTSRISGRGPRPLMDRSNSMPALRCMR
jgi:hypothetical protein